MIQSFLTDPGDVVSRGNRTKLLWSDSVFVCFTGWFCAERTHPHSARGSGEPLCGDAGVRHAARGSALQEGHSDWRAGRNRWRRVQVLFKPTLIISLLWACPKLYSISLMSPAGRSPVFSPATSLMCESSTRSSWTSSIWNSCTVTTSRRSWSCTSPTRHGLGMNCGFYKKMF